MELQGVETAHETRAHLEMRLTHGSYPEVVLTDSTEERERYLKELIASYLFKDILQLEGAGPPTSCCACCRRSPSRSAGRSRSPSSGRGSG